MRFIVLSLSIFALCINAQAGFAQDAVSILGDGGAVEAFLTGSSQAFWTFDGNSGDVISIEAESDEFDIRIDLLDTAGSIVISDEDSGKNSNALVRDYILTTTGVYVIAVDAADDRSGQYSISLVNSSYVNCSQYNEIVFETIDLSSAPLLDTVKSFDRFTWRVPSSWRNGDSNRSINSLPARGGAEIPGTVTITHLDVQTIDELETTPTCGLRQWLFETTDQLRSDFQVDDRFSIGRDQFVRLGEYEGAILYFSSDFSGGLNERLYMYVIIENTIVTIEAEFFSFQYIGLEALPVYGRDWVTPLLAMASTISTESVPPMLEGQTPEVEDQEDNVIFRDDFSSNSVSWEEAQEDNLNSEIYDGIYRLTFIPSTSFIYWVVAPGFIDWSVAPVITAPYELHFDVLNVYSSSPLYSMVVLFDVGQGYTPYKRLLIRNDWTWQLYRWTGQRELLGEGRLEGNPVDFQDGYVHHIVLRVDTSHYTLLIDEQVQLTIPSADMINGTVGFGMDSGGAQDGLIYAEFDNLVIRNIP